MHIISFFEWIVDEIESMFAYFKWYLIHVIFQKDEEDSDEEEEDKEPWTDADRLAHFHDTCEALLEQALEDRHKKDCINGPNTNICPIFYEKTLYDGLTDKEMERLCNAWSSRVILMSSPLLQQGNMLMYYDPMRLAFAYHCDFALPNVLLEGFAMKYVVQFRCLDFFVDETVYKSPLLPLHAIEDVKEKDDKEKKENDSVRDFLKEHSSAFIAKKETKKPKVVPLVVCNRFVYKGKMAEYSFLKRPVAPQKKVNEAIYGIKPSMDCLFEDVLGKKIQGMFDDLSTSTYSYKAYKDKKEKEVLKTE